VWYCLFGSKSADCIDGVKAGAAWYILLAAELFEELSDLPVGGVNEAQLANPSTLAISAAAHLLLPSLYTMPFS
jgi:hypothetical protein